MRIFGRARDLFIIPLGATPHEFYTRLSDLLSEIDETSIERCQRLIVKCCQIKTRGHLSGQSNTTNRNSPDK